MHAAKGRRRCTPKTAYQADAVVRVDLEVPRPALLPPNALAVFVECRLRGREPVACVDHHHPGDAGYSAAPHDYMLGSSLGQVLTLLDASPPRRSACSRRATVSSRRPIEASARVSIPTSC